MTTLPTLEAVVSEAFVQRVFRLLTGRALCASQISAELGAPDHEVEAALGKLEERGLIEKEARQKGVTREAPWKVHFRRVRRAKV
jgi:Mn-dependent DtxR family transcriptional regulator